MERSIDLPAAAIFEGRQAVGSTVTWSNCSETSRVLARVEAKYIAKRLREATEEMLAAADSAIPRFEPDEGEHRLMGRDGALVAWQAMIDQMLAS